MWSGLYGLIASKVFINTNPNSKIEHQLLSTLPMQCASATMKYIMIRHDCLNKTLSLLLADTKRLSC